MPKNHRYNPAPTESMLTMDAAIALSIPPQDQARQWALEEAQQDAQDGHPCRHDNPDLQLAYLQEAIAQIQQHGRVAINVWVQWDEGEPLGLGLRDREHEF